MNLPDLLNWIELMREKIIFNRRQIFILQTWCRINVLESTISQQKWLK